MMQLDKHVYNRGKIIIASRLSNEYYDLSAGFEVLAFGRISEALNDFCQGDAIITIDAITPVGGETSANKIWQWLVINVHAIDNDYQKEREFKKFLERLTYKALERLVAVDSYKAAIEIGDDYTVITDHD